MAIRSRQLVCCPRCGCKCKEFKYPRHRQVCRGSKKKK